MNSSAMFSDNQKSNDMNIKRDLLAALVHADGVVYEWQSEERLPEEMIEGSLSVAEIADAKIAYPWNVIEVAADEFFAECEQHEAFADLKADISDRSPVPFFAHLDQLWAATALEATQTALAERFAVRIPRSVLMTIADRAHQVVATSKELADQLVQCAEAVLPNLTTMAIDDLYVLARPLAYAMRDGEVEAISATEAKARLVEWQNLTEVEQACLSLAAARYALAELETTHAE